MAKRKTSSRAAPKKRRAPARQQPSLGAWVGAVVLIVGLIAVISYLNQPSSTKKSSHAWAEAFNAFKTPAVTASKTAPKAKPKPEFEFYTALPEGGLQPVKKSTAVTEIKKPVTVTKVAPAKATTAPVNTTNAKPVTAAPVKVKEQPSKANHYFLQVASFPQQKDANELRAKLLLEAYNANIQKISVNGKDWYRVVVGPYKDPAKLTQAQSELAKLHYKAIVLQTR